MIVDVNTLKANLKKGDVAPLYLILGPEGALQDSALAAFNQLLTADEQTMDFARLDMSTAPIAELLNETSSMPFYGERRVVIATDPQFLTGTGAKTQSKEAIDALTDYFSQPSPTTVLVISAPYEKLDERRKAVKRLRKNAVTVDAQQVASGAVSGRITKEIQAQGYTISNDALGLLVRKTEANYSTMVAQLPKLYLGAYPGHEITPVLVENLVPNTLTDNVFAVTDALMQQHFDQAVRVYQELLANQEEPLRLNALLLGQFRLLVQTKILARKGLNQMAIAKELNVHPFRIKLALRSNRAWPLATLVACYNELVHNEILFKSSQPDPIILFLRAVHGLKTA
jgi:DNA polymerase-3 subunit delta